MNSWVSGKLNLVGNDDNEKLEGKIEKYRTEKREELGYWIDEDWLDAVRFNGDGTETITIKISGHGKAYELVEDLKSFVKFCNKIGFQVDGKVYRNGEEMMDIERYKVDANVVSVSSPKIVFDDGEVYEEKG